MRTPVSFRLFLSLVAFAVGAHSIAGASSDSVWEPMSSPTSRDLTRILYGSATFVALAPGSAGDSVILHSADGEIWQEAALPAGVDLVDVAFGAGRFFAVGKRNGVPVALTSSDGAAWAVVENLPEIAEPLAGAAYLQGHFWAIPETGDLYVSTDLDTWNAINRGPLIQRLIEHDGSLLIPRYNGIGSFPWDGTSGLGWQERTTLPAPTLRSLASGTDRAVVLLAGGPDRSFAVSGDGKMWVVFEYGDAELNAVVAAAGHFFALGDGVVLSSTDGARWANRSAGAETAVLHSAAAGAGNLVAVGEGGVILRRSSAFAPAILGQPPAETVLAEGQPLLLAIEVEGGDEISVSWRRDDTPVEGASGNIFRKPSVSPADAGTYTAVVTNGAGLTVESAPASVAVTGPLEEAIEWEEMASLDGQLSRLAAKEDAMFAIAHASDFQRSLSETLPSDNPLAAAWSENGIHWRKATLPSRAPSTAAGRVRDLLWIGGAGSIAFSSDGIAWRQVRLHQEEGNGITLVGEHEGKLFATGGTTAMWTSEDGEVWTSQGGPVSGSGGYFSQEGLLTVASRHGIWEWDGENWRQDYAPSWHSPNQPRLAGRRGRALFLNRETAPSAFSRDMENWTLTKGELARDVLYIDGEFLTVGEFGARSSDEGFWWADRSGGLNSAVLSGIARAGDFLIAVGDNGKIFRRPAVLEPAFYQHPQNIAALPGQPVRLTARTVGSTRVQWYRGEECPPGPLPGPCDGPAPVEGGNGQVLEIAAFEAGHADRYIAVATNAVGSVASRAAVLDLQTSPLANPWIQVAELPANSSGSNPSPQALVSGNGMTLGTVPHDRSFALTQDGVVWARAQTKNEGELFFFAGGFFFALGSSAGGMVSRDGVFWEPRELPRIKSIVYANGLYVATAEDGIYWSEDAGAWTRGLDTPFSWPPAPVSYGNGVFLAVGNPFQVWKSRDGKQWTSATPPPSSTDRRPTALAFGNGSFVLAVTGPHSIATTSDGETWSRWQSSAEVRQLTFAGGNFWKSGSGLEVSANGRNWVQRAQGIRWMEPYRLITAGQTDVVALAQTRVFRRAGLLEPVLYGPLPSAEGAFPGENVVLQAPAAHGTPEFAYQWRRNGDLLPGASEATLNLQDIHAENGGVYTVEISNASGSASADLSVRYLGMYSEWSDYFRIGGQPREPGGDPGGHGVSNLLRYALHLDPVSPDRARLPRIEIEEMGGDRFPLLRFQLLAAAEDFAWTAEASPDLVAWEPLETGLLEADERQVSHRELTVRDTRPLQEGDQRRFLRLRIHLIDQQ